MEQQIKLSDLLASPQAFQELRGLKLPAKTAYWVAKLARQIDASLKDYHEAYMATIKKHREGTPDGEEISAEKLQALNDELKGLQEEPVKLDFSPIPLSTFDGMKVSTDMFLGLEWLIKEDAECAASNSSMPMP
jgi:hypothetical protein